MLLQLLSIVAFNFHFAFMNSQLKKNLYTFFTIQRANNINYKVYGVCKAGYIKSNLYLHSVPFLGLTNPGRDEFSSFETVNGVNIKYSDHVCESSSIAAMGYIDFYKWVGLYRCYGSWKSNYGSNGRFEITSCSSINV